MGKSNAFTSMEIDYIRAVYPQLTAAEIAKKLGRTKGAVNKRIKAMGLRDEAAPKPLEHMDGRDPQDTYDRLVEVREILRQQMTDAPPQSIAGIVKEYRAVLVEIDRMEGEGKKDDSDFFTQLGQAIANDLQT